MNRERQDKAFKSKLPLRLDSFYTECEERNYFGKYDGIIFSGQTQKAVFNKILTYIFNGGEK